jgi:hypothetical protein
VQPHNRLKHENKPQPPERCPLSQQPLLQPHDGSQHSSQPHESPDPQPHDGSQQLPQPQIGSQQPAESVQPHIGGESSQQQLYVEPANLRPSTQ